MRSRSVSDRILCGTLEVPAPPALLLADWERDIALQLQLEAGDVEPLSLARARLRWPDYKQLLQAAADWAGSLGLPGVLAASDIALMACRGARYHHDGVLYGHAAFCNLFLSEDKGLDLFFPSAGQRIPLVRGTAVIFDTCQPHAVLRRGSSGFAAADFLPAQDCSQVFLSWELSIEDVQVSQALGISFDMDPAAAALLDQGQLHLNGAPAVTCAASGRWSPAA